MLLLLLDEEGNVLSPEYVSDHKQSAEDRFLQQFKDSTNLKFLLCAWTLQVQDAEDGIDPLVLVRDINTATGDPLDSLGEAVGESRDGRNDDQYRLIIRARILINKSNGTPNELIAIVRQLVGDPTIIVELDEYNPATVFIRPRGVIIPDAATFAALLRQAKPAGVRLQFISSPFQPDNEKLFRYSDTTGVSEFASTHGYGNGTLTGVS